MYLDNRYTSLVHVFYNMKKRCYDELEPAYNNYGGRGINICQEWLENNGKFREWAINNGYKKGLSIDRIDNNGNYSPDNCRWVTRKIQNRNKRNNVFFHGFGEYKTLADWVDDERCPVGYDGLRKRLKKGMSIEKAFYKNSRTINRNKWLYNNDGTRNCIKCNQPRKEKEFPRATKGENNTPRKTCKYCKSVIESERYKNKKQSRRLEYI